jgi:hypothetical protein
MLKHYLSLPNSYYKTDHYYDFPSFFSCIPKTAALLNLGCGRASSLVEFPRGVGVDFNPKLWPIWKEVGVAERCCLLDVSKGLPWEVWNFDWTISTDFLEHVQPSDVPVVVDEILNAAPSGRHVIDLRAQSGYRGPGGENLHPSAMDEGFWREMFTRQKPSNLTIYSRRSHLFVQYGKVLD